MVHNQKFVVIVKVNDKVLREKGDIVYIPFGVEYEITLKNLNSIKAVAKIEVDGTDAMGGNQVIVPPNGSVTIEGFMKGRKVKNKFKFIEKTSQISAFRGDKVSDGLVRVTYQFEYVWPQQIYCTDPCSIIYGSGSSYGNNLGPNSGDVKYASSQLSSVKFTASGPSISGSSSRRVSSKAVNKSNTPKSYKNGGAIKCSAFEEPVNEDGITVKGSQSSQRFAVGSVGMLDAEKHVIVLQLKGRLKKKKVYKAVTVKTKVQCEICGKKNKFKYKFCVNCGTSLI